MNYQPTIYERVLYGIIGMLIGAFIAVGFASFGFQVGVWGFLALIVFCYVIGTIEGPDAISYLCKVLFWVFP